MLWNKQFKKVEKELANQKEKVKQQIRIFPKWLLVVVTTFLALVIIASGLFIIYHYSYQDKIYLGAKIGQVSLGGKNKVQARILIQAKIDSLANQGVAFNYQENELVVSPIITSSDEGGLTYELWSYDSQQIVDDLYNLGRYKKWWQNVFNQLHLLVFGSKGKVDYQLNQEEVVKILQEHFVEWESPGQDAQLNFEQLQVRIEEERTGQVFDYHQVLELLKKNLTLINNQPIQMDLIIDKPKVTKTESEFLIEQVELVIDLAPLTLSFKMPEYYQGRKRFEQTQWVIYKNELQEWLQLKYADKTLMDSDSSDNGEIYLGVNQNLIEEYLTEAAKIIDTPAKDAKFEIQNGKVIEWQSSSDGFILEIDKNIEHIENQLVKEKINQINLITSIDKSKITNENVNDLGIQELVGVGESNFAGSPNNRRHNIAVGAGTLNGVLIKPEEEFSLLEALGEVNAETGYKPELVIKEGRTIPEYGGGLCQIGTTMFRLAINTGLPIIQRRPHSYRVGYYEPAGFDATIYDPWPDFKFINDIGKHLLLQTRIEGNELIFEFWGTSDGRQVEIQGPFIYNIVKPGLPKYIDTNELEPGEEKRIERAHNGADAHFKRIITWPKEDEKEPLEETWLSHYVPWQEVWLRGKIATSSEKVTE